MANENRSNSFMKAFTYVDLTNIPGPRGRNFFRYVKGFQQDILGSFTRVYKDYGHIASFPWPMNSVIIYSPEFIKQVLVEDAKKYEKGEQIAELKAVVGNGLATNNDQESWLRSRAIVSREFGNRAVTEAQDLMLQMINSRFNSLGMKLQDEILHLDICEEMKSLTFEIACKIFLGLDAGSEETKKVSAAVGFTSKVTYERIFQLFPLPYWIPTKKHVSFNRHYQNLNEVVSKVMDDRGKQGMRPCVLTRLMDAEDPETREKLSRSELRDEILTIMLAGHETSAHSLTWTFSLLARNRQVQQKLFDEIVSLDFSNLENVTEKTPYLQLVLLESMRLYPAFPVLSRKTKHQATLGPYSIPPKTNVVIPIYVIQRSPEFWENPQEFVPERFLKDENKKTFAYLPFSRGQRKCVAEIFAMTEMSLIVIHLIRKFELKLEEKDFPLEEAAVSLKPEKPFQMVLKPRSFPSHPTRHKD